MTMSEVRCTVQCLSVSCVICFHREGILAHTTLHAIERARQRAEAEGFSVQLVITLDNHDPLTEGAVVGHPALRHEDIVDSVRFGDAGASRNHGIGKTSGEYIIIADGDDYCSENFIIALARQAAQSSENVAFPEYLFVFGTEQYYARMGGPADPQENAYALFCDNFFSSRVAAHRDVFLRIPFAVCGQGYGYEDWHWACEAVAAGLKLVPAPGVVLFYRRRSGSRLEIHAQAKTIIPFSKFFEMLPPPQEALPTALPVMPPPQLSRKALARELSVACLQFLPLRLADRLYLWMKSTAARVAHRDFPPAIQCALQEISAVDGVLHPDVVQGARCGSPTYDTLPGKVYAAIWHELQGRHFDVVYLVPHISVGGADLMVKNYMAAMQAAGKRVLCLIMYSSSRELAPVHEGGTVLHFARHANCLCTARRQGVLLRLLVQLRPAVIHAVCEDLAFGVLEAYSSVLREQSRLYATIFADAQDEQDRHVGMGTQYLSRLLGHCSKLITDNMQTAREWHVRLGLPLEFFHAVYGVARLACSPQAKEGRRVKMLWAGRLDKEKRLDILLAIARALPDTEFDVYGHTVLEKDSAIEALARLPNVSLCGGYRNFYELPVQQYTALVYTTHYDGLPNVLLEAAGCGLPLIAPDRGGISDFVSEATGWLIASHTDVDAYVQAIRTVAQNPQEAVARAQRAQELLRRRHTPEAFSASLLDAYGFSSDMSGRSL